LEKLPRIFGIENDGRSFKEPRLAKKTQVNILGFLLRGFQRGSQRGIQRGNQGDAKDAWPLLRDFFFLAFALIIYAGGPRKRAAPSLAISSELRLLVKIAFSKPDREAERDTFFCFLEIFFLTFYF
jgi:hypothetical protein